MHLALQDRMTKLILADMTPLEVELLHEKFAAASLERMMRRLEVLGTRDRLDVVYPTQAVQEAA